MVQREPVSGGNAELEILAAVMEIFDVLEAVEKSLLFQCHEKRGLLLYNPKTLLKGIGGLERPLNSIHSS